MTTSSKSKKSNTAPLEVSIKVGWLHCQKQVKLGGAGIRKVTFEGDEIDHITPEVIAQKASHMFFPGGQSKMGALSDMVVRLGTYSRDVVNTFTTLDGEPCSYLQHVKEFGLFRSTIKYYLMTTPKTTAKQQCDSEEETKDSKELKQRVTERERKDSKDAGEAKPTAGSVHSSSRGGIFNEISGLTLLDELEPQLMVISTANSPVGELCIEYEEIRESSYSEVLMRSLSYNIKQCYDLQSLLQPEIKETPLREYSPLEMGPYHVSRLQRGGIYYLNLEYEPSKENPEIEESRYTFPQADEEAGLILHPPSQMWGYDHGRLIAAVIASCHGEPNANYSWCKEGAVYKQGTFLSSICIDEPGTYFVRVEYGEAIEETDTFLVEPIRLKPETSSVVKVTTSTFTEDAPQPETLPVIDKSELTLADEIGSGSFGKVYKSDWAGTPVAVKVIKVRNAKRVSSLLENEIRVHSSVRHPYIVQMMGVSYLKNSIYLVSELVEGNNLDEILFKDDGSCDLDHNSKMSICRQLCQAIAYMHNLKPSIIHRDIKPANVIVSRNHVTKLCDMGLSQFKSTQSLNTKTSVSVPGTPQYMAPECLVSRKKATSASDIWSLGCTLVECFLCEDLWREELDKEENDGQVDALISILKAGEPPKSLNNLADSTQAVTHQVLAKCFDFTPSNRPTARDVLASLEH